MVPFSVNAMQDLLATDSVAKELRETAMALSVIVMHNVSSQMTVLPSVNVTKDGKATEKTVQILTNASKTCAIRCVLIASTLWARIIVAASPATKEMASIAYLMVPVMESNAMLMPLVLNRRVKNLVSVYAKLAGRATEGLVKRMAVVLERFVT